VIIARIEMCGAFSSARLDREIGKPHSWREKKGDDG